MYENDRKDITKFGKKNVLIYFTTGYIFFNLEKQSKCEKSSIIP